MADNPLLPFLLAVEMRSLRRERVFRDRTNALELPDTLFISLFRLSKPLVLNLCDELRDLLQPQTTRRTALTVENKVMIALRFLATGSYQRCVGQDLTIAVSQRCISHTLRTVVNAINKKLMNKYITFPRSSEEQNLIKAGFANISGFPGVIGAIDGTLIAIIVPKTVEDIREDLFLGRKGYHCINTQLVCDSNLKILNVNARYPGATHDSFIWKNSLLRCALEMDYRNGRNNAWLIGDQGYPLEPWLLTPIGGAREDSVEARFNKSFGKARIKIEHCIGILKQHFRCLLKHRVLHYSPETASKIINSCVVLHNICISNNLYESYDDNDDDSNNSDNDDETDPNMEISSEQYRTALESRNNIVRMHFANKN